MSPAQASAVRLLDGSLARIGLDGPPDPETVPVVDLRGRPLRDLRVSVTDRCNLRCAYCMPEEHYEWLPNGSFLSIDELSRVIGAFADAGVSKVRLTGGEPLL
ncbi:MAG: radical SAM protein, partial [Acidimicrobiales bacterium]|nr:radical SAM protein [Acidimicrobiales bacterium]